MKKGAERREAGLKKEVKIMTPRYLVKIYTVKNF